MAKCTASIALGKIAATAGEGRRAQRHDAGSPSVPKYHLAQKQWRCIVVGGTDSRYFPLETPIQGSLNAPFSVDIHQADDADAFLLKLKPHGSGLLFSTYFGSSSYDRAAAVRLDTVGSAYVMGVASGNNP